MVIKVVTYLNIEGKVSVEEGNELIRDCRTQVTDFLIQSFKKRTTAILSNGRKVDIEFLTEAEAKKKVIGTAKIDFANPSSHPNLPTVKERLAALRAKRDKDKK